MTSRSSDTTQTALSTPRLLQAARSRPKSEILLAPLVTTRPIRWRYRQTERLLLLGPPLITQLTTTLRLSDTTQTVPLIPRLVREAKSRLPWELVVSQMIVLMR